MAEQLITVSLEVQLLAKTFETALMGAAGSGGADPILPLGTAFPGLGSSAATYLKREATLSNSAGFTNRKHGRGIIAPTPHSVEITKANLITIILTCILMLIKFGFLAVRGLEQTFQLLLIGVMH